MLALQLLLLLLEVSSFGKVQNSILVSLTKHTHCNKPARGLQTKSTSAKLDATAFAKELLQSTLLGGNEEIKSVADLAQWVGRDLLGDPKMAPSVKGIQSMVPYRTQPASQSLMSFVLYTVPARLPACLPTCSCMSTSDFCAQTGRTWGLISSVETLGLAFT